MCDSDDEEREHGLVISNLSEGMDMLEMPEEDDSLIEDVNGKVRNLQEWVEEYRKFVDEELEELNNRTKEPWISG